MQVLQATNAIKPPAPGFPQRALQEWISIVHSKASILLFNCDQKPGNPSVGLTLGLERDDNFQHRGNMGEISKILVHVIRQTAPER